jgi:hypothetical protein
MKELEDLPWFPQALREFQTDHIGFLASRWHLYDAFIAYGGRVAPRWRPQVDLCSGSGEPAISLHQQLGPFTPLTLTDLYPHRGIRTPPGVTYQPHPVDARAVRVMPEMTYTMFNAFHHFPAAEQQQLVRRLRRGGAEAFLVEILEPTLACMVKVLLATTVGVLVLTPFVRPFRWDRLFFTYLLPVNVLTITWDGVVSVLRSRTASAFAQLLVDEGPEVQVHRLRGRLLPITVIHILPS